MYHRNRPEKAWVLPPTGPVREIEGDDFEELFERFEDTGWEASFEKMRPMIDCQVIERVVISTFHGELFVDEEGRFKDVARNRYATLLSREEIFGTGVFIAHERCNVAALEKLFHDVAKAGGWA